MAVWVLLNSHVLTELERVASYLILLARGQSSADQSGRYPAAAGQPSLAAGFSRITTSWPGINDESG